MSLRQKIMLGIAAVLAVAAVWRYVTYEDDGNPAGKDFEARISKLEHDGNVSGLAAEIADSQIEAARMALSALGRIGTPEATGHIGRAMTGKKDVKIRAAAAAVIGKSRAYREMDSLLTVMVNDEKSVVRLSAANAVNVIIGRRCPYDARASLDRRRADVDYIRQGWQAAKKQIIKYHEMKRKQRH